MANEQVDLEKTHALLEPLSAQERLLWAHQQFGENLVLLSSMQRTASVLMHLFYKLGLNCEVLFVDTGFHFSETLRTRDEWIRKFHLNVVTLYPELTCEAQEARYERKLFACVDGQPDCCRMRKEDPLLSYLRQHKSHPVIINGLRRGEGGRRANVQVMSPDPRVAGYGFSPLFDWSSAAVSEYLQQNDLLVHPLHEQGYPSIGCFPCTTPVAPGEDSRAGRWRHLRPAGPDAGPQYCQINFTDGAGI
jgi:phosphoadenosine phosphosulfate reductase